LKLFIFYFFLASSISVFAQPLLKGTVYDKSTNQPFVFCTVALKNTIDSSIAMATRTSEKGEFTFISQNKTTYLLEVSCVGYETFIKKIDLSRPILNEKITLSPIEKIMNQVEIVFEKEAVKKEAGKTTYDLTKATTSTGGTLEDALRNLPNISVDQRGAISIAGKKSVTIWLDGKPSTMAQVDVGAFIKSIPSSSIERIEVITNPSAKYDAAGSGGIIHIHLKKDKRNGFNGNVDVGYGWLSRGSIGTNLNYRKNKWTLFGSYNLNRSYNGHNYNEDRSISLVDSSFYYLMKNNGTDYNLSNTVKAGIDFAANENTVWSFSSSIVQKNSNEDARTNSTLRDASQSLQNLLFTNNFEKGNTLSLVNDISVRNTLDTSGAEVSASLTHSFVKSSKQPGLITTTFDSQMQPISASNLNRITPIANNIHNLIFQFDFSQPTKFKSKLETGLKNETSLTQNDYKVFDKISNTYELNTLLSNNFRYTENIAAFYVLLSGPLSKWLEYSAGIRTEHSYIKSSTASINRNYVSFFPNASLTASFAKVHSLGVTYDRRINRPTFQLLNNSITFNDPYSTWQGNPNLKPVFSDAVEMNYTYMQKKWMLSLDAGYSYIGGSYTEGTRLDSLGISRSQYINGSHQQAANVGLYIKLNFLKWWELQMNHSYQFQHYAALEGINNGAVRGHLYNLWASTTFKFWKNASVQVSGWMNTGGVGPQGRSFPSGSVGLAIKKSFLKDKLTITINGVNLANTMNFRWEINNGGLHTLGGWQVLNRTVFLNLSYRFGDSQKLKRIERETNSRLGGSGGR
jgi:outer membrane receptor protein involved in Fe transport